MLKNKEYVRIGAIILFLIILIMIFAILFQEHTVEALSKYGSRGEEVRQIQTKL